MMDQLAMDAKRCMEDGFGPHYGAWKAQHPNTREENEPLIAAYLEEAALSAAEKRERARIKVCPVCGKEYLPTRELRKYCSAECQKKDKRAPMRVSYRNTEKHLVCSWCGKPFTHYGRASRKYCCAACENAYRAAQKREARKILQREEYERA